MSWQSPWPDIAAQLEYQYPNRFIYDQSYNQDNFLYPFAPVPDDAESFFGTKTVNIFIAQKPYGWKDAGDNNWNFDGLSSIEGYDDTLTRIQDSQDRFAFYRLLIYVDVYSALQYQKEHPDTDWPYMMETTADAIRDSVKSSSPYIVYMGKLEEQVDYSFFLSQTDEFLQKQNYHKY